MFYPIEDQAELARLRSLMSPFMISIQKCFSTTEYQDPNQQKEQIFDDVINSISPIVDPELLNGLNQIIAQPENSTIGLEQGALRQISRRYFRFKKMLNVTLLKLIPTP